MSLLEELKRRHVFRVAAAYAVTGWLVLQLADIVLPTFGAPAWVMKAVIALFVLLFPVALVLAWAFELTPEGVRRTEAVDAEPSVRRPRGRTLNVAIALGLVAAVGILAWRHFAPGGGGAAAARTNASTAPGPAVPARSVAVLPFVNMSGDTSYAYFSDGVTEEILNALAQIPGLKVAGRTSSFAYKGKSPNLSDVGRALHVATVLEGSVQRAGRQVRITARLIDARTDFRIWSNEYTRELGNVFALEDEISGAIADALQLKLGSGRPRSEAHGTSDSEAHDLYLLGLQYWNRRTPSDLERAIGYFRQAIARDSTYADAWAGLADALVVPSAPMRPSRALSQAIAAARKALALDPDLAQAHTALAYALMSYAYDWDGARREFERAIALDPDYPTAHQWYAEWLAAQGRTAEAVESARRAEELDPLSLIIGWNVGRELALDRQLDAARRQFEKVLAMHPDLAGEVRARSSLAKVALLQGDTADLRRQVVRLREALPDSFPSRMPDSIRRMTERLGTGTMSELAARLRRINRLPGPTAAERDRLLALLERQVEFHDIGGEIPVLVASPAFDPVRQDPRYQAILRELGLEAAGRLIEQRIGAP